MLIDFGEIDLRSPISPKSVTQKPTSAGTKSTTAHLIKFPNKFQILLQVVDIGAETAPQWRSLSDCGKKCPLTVLRTEPNGVTRNAESGVTIMSWRKSWRFWGEESSSFIVEELDR
jgi:hypothetical protein